MLVMADGCFDPVHEGHIEYLRAARRLGSRLVVNIARDPEIWEKRPQLGPFLSESGRIALIGALKPVDEVVLLPTSEALRMVRPDIYVKGNDWLNRFKDDERAICEDLGIQIRFLDSVLNSSTRILETFVERILASGPNAPAADHHQE